MPMKELLELFPVGLILIGACFIMFMLYIYIPKCNCLLSIQSLAEAVSFSQLPPPVQRRLYLLLIPHCLQQLACRSAENSPSSCLGKQMSFTWRREVS